MNPLCAAKMVRQTQVSFLMVSGANVKAPFHQTSGYPFEQTLHANEEKARLCVFISPHHLCRDRGEACAWFFFKVLFGSHRRRPCPSKAKASAFVLGPGDFSFGWIKDPGVRLGTACRKADTFWLKKQNIPVKLSGQRVLQD